MLTWMDNTKHSCHGSVQGYSNSSAVLFFIFIYLCGKYVGLSFKYFQLKSLFSHYFDDLSVYADLSDFEQGADGDARKLEEVRDISDISRFTGCPRSVVAHLQNFPKCLPKHGNKSSTLTEYNYTKLYIGVRKMCSVQFYRVIVYFSSWHLVMLNIIKISYLHCSKRYTEN